VYYVYIAAKIGSSPYCPSSSAPKETPKSWICFEGAFAEGISAVAWYLLNTKSAA